VLEPGTGLSVYYPTWAIASAYLFQDLLCARLKCYGPNVVLLHSGVPVRLYFLRVWGVSLCFCNESHCITYHLQVACTHQWPSIPHSKLQESACCKFKTRQVRLTKSIDAATAGVHWSRCRHCMRLQLPLPLSLIRFCSSCLQWICNYREGFWIRDEGRQVFKTAGRSGSASNAKCMAGYNTTRWICRWLSSRCWCITTACTRRGGWTIYWRLQCSWSGGSHALSDIDNARIFQLRWGRGFLTLDCRRYGTPSLRGIAIASRYGNASLSRGQLRMSRGPTLLLILTISKSSNIVYDWRFFRVRAVGRHSPI